MSRLCSICARGGSKGVPNKNLRKILGRTLLSHSLDQARQSKLFEIIAVSSDSDEILAEAKNSGADVVIKRPLEMALDTSAKLPAIQHCAREVEKATSKKFSTFVDLDATSPLRSVEDIIGATQLLESSKFLNVVTGSKAHRSPYFNLVELKEGGRVTLSKKLDSAITRRQDSPVCYDLNASIYVWTREGLFAQNLVLGENTGFFEMPTERSLDIDSQLDFEIVEFIMKRRS